MKLFESSQKKYLFRILLSMLLFTVFCFALHIEYLWMDLESGSSSYYGTTIEVRGITLIVLLIMILSLDFHKLFSKIVLIIFVFVFLSQFQIIKTVSIITPPTISTNILGLFEVSEVSLCAEGSADDIFYDSIDGIIHQLKVIQTTSAYCDSTHKLIYIRIPILIDYDPIDRAYIHRPVSHFFNNLLRV